MSQAADRAFLDGQQHLVFPREAEQEINVEWLGEPRIGDRRRQPCGGKLVGCLQAFGKSRAI